MYHSIGSCNIAEAGAERYCVLPKAFKEQMRYIKQGQFLLVTFDDGDITNFKYAYPMLKEMRLKAYFFIIAKRVGANGYMNWQQIKELSNAGMVIGSHGMTHRILTELTDRELDYELRASKKLLEENLGRAIDYFSIPRGFYNRRVIDEAKEVGYKAIFTSNPKDNDGFKFGRIAVKAEWDLEKFMRIVNNGLPWRDSAREFVKKASQKIMGAKSYDKLRTIVLAQNSKRKA